MMDPMATSSQIAAELRDQWELLRTRLVDAADATLDEPSTLPGWTVRDLVAHLGLSLGVLSRCEPLGTPGPAAGTDTDPALPEPLSFGGYLASYAGDGDSISDRVLAYSTEIAASTVAAVDEVADRALARADELAGAGDEALVRTGRGVIRVRDLLLTRLVELVVHGYDLAPALADPVPVDTGARHLVAEALVRSLDERTGYRLFVADEAAWIGAATGRISWEEAVAQDAVRPEYLSDGVPDLSGILPLL